MSVRSQFRPVDNTVGFVVIGLGDPNPKASVKAVILNHKGYRAETFASVSQFVASASDKLWLRWRTRIATSADIMALVVEDYSLDTCFAWLLFGARLEGKPASLASQASTSLPG